MKLRLVFWCPSDLGVKAFCKYAMDYCIPIVLDPVTGRVVQFHELEDGLVKWDTKLSLMLRDLGDLAYFADRYDVMINSRDGEFCLLIDYHGKGFRSR